MPHRPCLALALLIAVPAAGQLTPSPSQPFFLPAEMPAVGVDPLLDGRASDNPEWADGMRLPDAFFFGAQSRSGFYWFERKLDWHAVPLAGLADGAGITYPGQTLFIAHDIIGSSDPANPLHQFQVDEDRDWNSFDFPVPGGRATIWVFDGLDDADDSDWLPFAEGLDGSALIPEGTAPNLLDDRGFIARLNDDPSSDVHWFPGDPEPGTAGWDWADWHWVFGRRSFGQSFQDVLLDTDPENAVDHEVYEACAYRPDQDPEGEPPPWCLWWDVQSETEIEVLDTVIMKDGVPTKAKVKVPKTKLVPILKGQWWLHQWDENLLGLGVPDPAVLAFFIQGQLNQAAQASDPPEKALQDVDFAIGFLTNAMFSALAQEWNNAWLMLKFARIHEGRALKKGFDPLAWVQARMLVVSFFYWTVARHWMELDGGLESLAGDGAPAGLPADDPGLLKASRGLYGFGKALRAKADQGAKGQRAMLSTLNRLKRATKELDKLGPE